MTRLRLAATAALSITALLVATSGGEAQRGDRDRGEARYRLSASCKTAQRTERDFVKVTSSVDIFDRPGPGRAARFVPADNVKVVTKLKDLTTQDGNDVVDGKDTDKTNDGGVAKTKLEFDNFGNYRVTAKAKVDGEVVADDTIKFGVADRESGACDPPLVGGPGY